MFSGKIKRVVAVMLALALMVALAGCGEKSSTPNGRYEATDDYLSAFTYFDFKGSKVEIGVGSAGTTLSNETIQYSFKDDVLSFDFGGTPIEIAYNSDNDTLTLAGAVFTKVGVVTTVKSEEATPAFNGAKYVSTDGKTSLTIKADGTFTLDKGGSGQTTGTVEPDGSVGEWKPCYDSYVLSGTELTKVGGKNIAEHERERFNKLPDITLKHASSDSLSAGDYGIFDGSLYAKRVYEQGGDAILGNAKSVVKYVNTSTYFVITGNSELYAFGENGGGLVGDGTGVNKSEPVKILDNVIDVVPGVTTVAFTANGDLYYWGASAYDAYGWVKEILYKPELLSQNVAEIVSFIVSPVLATERFLKTNGDFEVDGVVVLKKVKKIVNVSRLWSVSDSVGRVAVIFSDDSFYTYPNLTYPPNAALPMYNEKIMDNVKGVYLGGQIIVLKDGQMFGKGKNEYGQFGDGTKIDKDSWTKLADGVDYYENNQLTTSDYVKANDGYGFRYVKQDGSIWAWKSDDPTPQQLPQ
jgi:hypothetical protein